MKHAIAIVTGGASGIGRALSKELARRGATVIVADINSSLAETVIAEITAVGGSSAPATVDVTDAQAVQELVEGVVASHGRIDYMFNNAGISMTGEARYVHLEDWARMISVNLHGVINGVQAVYPIMRQQGSGHIVNTASIAGLAPFPLSVVYCATKHAVAGLSTALRTEAAGYGVKVSVVCPGFIDTPLKDTMPYRNIDKEAAIKALPFRFETAENCAAATIRGVLRNRAVIVTPFHARVLWWLYRLVPQTFTWVGARAANRSRHLLSLEKS